ncbi:hypothetical protein BVI1335_70072 [Burkholderia vietnamiensis]|nr:hypothetical protein BVI1335_70072 [Burkholderia vietnamiensis]
MVVVLARAGAACALFRALLVDRANRSFFSFSLYRFAGWILRLGFSDRAAFGSFRVGDVWVYPTVAAGLAAPYATL